MCESDQVFTEPYIGCRPCLSGPLAGLVLLGVFYTAALPPFTHGIWTDLVIHLSFRLVLVIMAKDAPTVAVIGLGESELTIVERTATDLARRHGRRRGEEPHR